jgi:D-glycero-D-manno-heptose 1,7-bisphosphate phosphatase
MNVLNRAVFFDRDGVLNRAVIKNNMPFPPYRLEDLQIDEYAQDAVKRIRERKFLLICITNQPDFSRGLNTLENINKINDKVKTILKLEDLFCCFHDNKDNCSCRKPKPGMFFEASKKWNIDLKQSFMIGDRKSDILAGAAAGVKSIFIDNNYAEPKPENCDFVCYSLKSAVDYILENFNA